MFKGPCKDCDLREPGCHDHCASFKHAKEEYECEKERSKNDEEYRSYVLSSCFKRWNDDLIRKKKHKDYNKFKGHH